MDTTIAAQRTPVKTAVPQCRGPLRRVRGPERTAQQKQFFPVFQGTLRADRVSERGHHHWRLNVFGRADVRDRRQSHAELREATWAWRPNQTWDVRGGILADEWGQRGTNSPREHLAPSEPSVEMDGRESRPRASPPRRIRLLAQARQFHSGRNRALFLIPSFRPTVVTTVPSLDVLSVASFPLQRRLYGVAVRPSDISALAA
jgi:hypothetical protein